MKFETKSILPKNIDNEYRGNKVSKYMFLLFTLVTIIRSLIHIFSSDGGAQSIATIPLDSYPSAAAATVVLMFALWGLSQLLMSIVYVVVFIRYQSLIPAMYILLIIEYTMRMVVGMMKPIVTVGTAPGGIGNFILVPLCIILFLMSIKVSKKHMENSDDKS
ncbi:MAG: hypothetical protein KGZ51_00690 [Erysipelothrix sp.]|nr:hypothetical protein [Erysipelothrix sp.]